MNRQVIGLCPSQHPVTRPGTGGRRVCQSFDVQDLGGGVVCPSAAGDRDSVQSHVVDGRRHA